MQSAPVSIGRKSPGLQELQRLSVPETQSLRIALQLSVAKTAANSMARATLSGPAPAPPGALHPHNKRNSPDTHEKSGFICKLQAFHCT